MSDEAITDYWARHYVDREILAGGLCTLCGNWGWVDTTGAKSPTGLKVGRRQPCICPNGQSVREHGRVVGVAARIKR